MLTDKTTAKARMVKLAPSYVVTRGDERLYYCPICAWTYPYGHEHFDHSKQSRLRVVFG